MKVKAIINFNDLENNVHRNIGDIFDCTEKRANYLLEHNAVEVVEQEKIIVNNKFIINGEEVKNEIVKPKKKNKKK